ncbi:hypothetical protein VZ94_08420 [Methylocucumis oryzae]|uniref:Uncharacterized protein n=1 Tax=Methylocucumis oryzae TaxID=1632867 RepID=A0A0F3IJD7_9GAMM|nr:hypothetical protein VZ94_08420 [Methylocucumis oryzae]
MLGIAMRGFAEELGLVLEVTAMGTQHQMKTNRKALANAEFFVQPLRNEGGNVAATKHSDAPC